MDTFRMQRAPSIILTAITCLLISAASTLAMQAGHWAQSFEAGGVAFKDVYHGISYAPFEGDFPEYDVRNLAKNRALDDLCYKLSVTVQSKFEDNLIKKGDYETQNVISSLYISTRNILSGVEEKDVWTDVKNHRFWILLVIDKERADKQLEQQRFINDVVDRLENKQDEILAGIRDIASVLQTNLQAYNESITKLEGLISSIDSKMESASSQTKSEYAAIQADIKKLNDERQLFESIIQNDRQRQQQIQTIIDQNNELKAQLSQVLGKVQKDYFLALAGDDLQYKSAANNFAVHIRPAKGQGADYYSGEKIKFYVSATQDCYIKVIYISSTGSDDLEAKRINTILFPNQHDRGNRIKAGETVVIGKRGEIEVGEPYGKDIVSVVASKTQFSDLNDITGKPMAGMQSEITSNTRDAIDLRYRGLKVVNPNSTYAGKADILEVTPDAIATDTCFLVSHPQ